MKLRLIAATLAATTFLTPVIVSGQQRNSGGAGGVNTVGSNVSNPAFIQNASIGYYVTPEMCGAAGDDTTDDTVAIENAISIALGATACGINPSGSAPAVVFQDKIYKVTSDIIVDMGTETNNVGSHGLKLICVGSGSCVIDGTTVTTTPVLEIRCSSPTSVCNNLIISGGNYFGIKGGNGTGPVFVAGRSDLADEIENSFFRILLQNFNTASSGAQGVVFNNVQASDISLVNLYGNNNNTTTGDGIQLNEVQNSIIRLMSPNWSTNASAAVLHLNGADVGNQIFAKSINHAGIGVLIDNAGATNNTFSSPSFPGVTADFKITNGAENLILNPLWGAGAHYSAGSPLGSSEIDSSFLTSGGGNCVNPASGSTCTMLDPPPFKEYPYMLINSATDAALTIAVPRCTGSNGAGSDGKTFSIGSNFAVTTLTMSVQTTGGIADAPTSLVAGSAYKWICRGGEGEWRPIL